MTYCVAWQSKGTAFLIADAAKTSVEPPASRQSTFGELQERERGLTVQEAALKIFRWPKLAITCSGEIQAITSFIHQIDREIARGRPPWIALAQVSIKTRRGFQAVAATRFLGDTRLLHLQGPGQLRYVKPSEIVHLGSPNSSTKRLVEEAIADAHWICGTPESYLACVLAACQSLTVHERLMAQGAGGAFTGIMIDRQGTRWQPDIAYLVMNPDEMESSDAQLASAKHGLHVSCAVRDDILFVSSTTKRGAVAFSAPTTPGIPQDIQSRVKEAFDKARPARDNCCYAFVSVMSNKWPLTAVIEMLGRPTSPFLKLGYRIQANNDRAVVIELERRVTRFLRGLEGTNGPRLAYYYVPDMLAAAHGTPNPHPSSTPR